MSHAHSTHKPVNDISQNTVSAQLAETFAELQDTPHAVTITKRHLSNTERSVFYRDETKRVYQLNPREHPGLVGILHGMFTTLSETTGVDMSRDTPRTGYVITVTTNTDCDCTSTNGHSTPDVDSIYPEHIAREILRCPFEKTPVTCVDGIEREAVFITEPGTTQFDSTGSGNMTEIPGASFELTPVPDREPELNAEMNGPVMNGNGAVSSVTIGQQQAGEHFAKYMSILDAIEYVRTHPNVQNGVINKPTATPGNGSGDETSEFNECCTEFLIETAPGWRLRWILEVVTDKHRPVSNIANAANVSHEEANVTLQLLAEWGVVSVAETPRGDQYKLNPEYGEWVANTDETGFETVEIEYLHETRSIPSLITSAYTTLSNIDLGL